MSARTEQPRRGDWMQTYSGRVFWPMDPRADEIEIVDIAHALSNACRYAGHSLQFYSVAEHSVLMSRALHAFSNKRWALLHDASEAYLVDVPRPVKPFLPGYREAEDAVMEAVIDRFGLERVGTQGMPDAVKAADSRILNDERQQNMAACRLDWNLEGPPLGVTLRFWSPEEAEREFLIAFNELWPEQRVRVGREW